MNSRIAEALPLKRARGCVAELRFSHDITRILNLMEKKGYIRRIPDEYDRRRYNIFLTKKSREIQEILTSTVIDFIEKAFTGLTRGEIMEMQKLHKHIIGNIEALLKKA